MEVKGLLGWVLMLQLLGRSEGDPHPRQPAAHGPEDLLVLVAGGDLMALAVKTLVENQEEDAVLEEANPARVAEGFQEVLVLLEVRALLPRISFSQGPGARRLPIAGGFGQRLVSGDAPDRLHLRAMPHPLDPGIVGVDVGDLVTRLVYERPTVKAPLEPRDPRLRIAHLPAPAV